jgi:hypothetical protein
MQHNNDTIMEQYRFHQRELYYQKQMHLMQRQRQLLEHQQRISQRMQQSDLSPDLLREHELQLRELKLQEQQLCQQQQQEEEAFQRQMQHVYYPTSSLQMPIDRHTLEQNFAQQQQRQQQPSQSNPSLAVPTRQPQRVSPPSEPIQRIDSSNPSTTGRSHHISPVASPPSKPPIYLPATAGAPADKPLPAYSQHPPRLLTNDTLKL